MSSIAVNKEYNDEIGNIICIDNINIDKNQNKNEKIKNFVETVKNPYKFVCKDYVVNVEFSSNSKTIQSLIESYFIRKKQI